MTTDNLFSAGSYYVGDLCYVLKEKNGYSWKSFCGEWDSKDGGYATIFHFEGQKVFCSNTAFGDGSFYDQRGRSFSVDSGSIGIWPMDKLPSNINTQGGHVLNFDEPFKCFPCDSRGNIHIGHLTISTGEENDVWEDQMDSDSDFDDNEEWEETEDYGQFDSEY